MKMPKKISDNADKFLNFMETFPPVKRRIIVCTAAFIIVFGAVFAVVVTHKTKLELKDYITAEFSGHDSSGTADIKIDSEKLAKDILKYGKNLDRKPTKSDIKSMFMYKYESVDESGFSELDSIGDEQLENIVKESSKLDIGVDVDIADEDKIGYYMIGECYSFEVENELVQLKNGDKLTVTFTANNDIAKKYKLKFGTKKMTVTVSGLEE